jgi:hypothetical protein
MFLHLFTAGVLLASAFMGWAFIAPGPSKARVMFQIPAVRLRGKMSVVAEALGFAFGGVFASGHANEHLVHTPHFALVEDVRRVLARPLANKTRLGFCGYPPYLR